MSKVCEITGKRPVAGNHVSHAHNKTKRRFMPNLQVRRYWSDELKRTIKLRVSTKGIRIIDKLGVDAAIARRKNKTNTDK
jgi:large subunit ribosomal protein L28